MHCAVSSNHCQAFSLCLIEVVEYGNWNKWIVRDNCDTCLICDGDKLCYELQELNQTLKVKYQELSYVHFEDICQ